MADETEGSCDFAHKAVVHDSFSRIISISDAISPTQSIPTTVESHRQENIDSDEEPDFFTTYRTKKRIQDSDEKDKYINDDTMDEKNVKTAKPKSRIKIFTSSDESDVMSSKENGYPKNNTRSTSTEEQTNNGLCGAVIDEIGNPKSHMKPFDETDESDDDGTISVKYSKNNIKNTRSETENGVSRISKKRDLFMRKFRDLKTSRNKNSLDKTEHNVDSVLSDSPITGIPDLSNICDDSDSSENTNMKKSVVKIKKKCKKQRPEKLVKTDSSDEEINDAEEKQYKKEKLTKPQNNDPVNSRNPIRMSAKQAIENMQVIKSESNRMLRDKRVSLPYHRPKPLSLKEIMNRRRPAITADGKELPLKMNEDQLKHYALQLQQQQKELIELCKSDDSEEENLEDFKDNDKNPEGYKVMLEKLITTNEFNNSDEIYESKDADVSNSNKPENPINNDLPSIEFNGTIDCNINNECNDKIIENQKSLSANDQKSESENSNIYIDSIEITENSNNGHTQNVNHLVGTDRSNCVNNEKSNCDILKSDTEQESQLIKLHYDSEKMDIDESNPFADKEPSSESGINNNGINLKINLENTANNSKEEYNKNSNIHSKTDDISALLGNLSEEDIEMCALYDVIDNSTTVVMPDDSVKKFNLPEVVQGSIPLYVKPKLSGVPGMVIDFDSADPTASKKMSGIEHLKERFQYFAKIKTSDELEREKEKKVKPGTLHSKLKQELEDKIAEQRSLEWSRRLEEEEKEKTLLADAENDDKSCAEDILEEIEAKLNEVSPMKENNPSDIEMGENDSAEDSELEENDVSYKDTNKKTNPLIDYEAEESDADDEYEANNSEHDGDSDKDDESSNTDNSSESSDDEEVSENVKRKGRILKAFEDSDEENNRNEDNCGDNSFNSNENLKALEPPQYTQVQKIQSDDLFASQTSNVINNSYEQTPAACTEGHNQLSKSHENKIILQDSLQCTEPSPYNDQVIEKLPVICDTQADDEVNLDDVALMCSGTFSQNLVTSQVYIPNTQISNTQNIIENDSSLNDEELHQDEKAVCKSDVVPLSQSNLTEPLKQGDTVEFAPKKPFADENLLRSILDEMDEVDLDKPKPNKYFCAENSSTAKEDKKNCINVEQKKKFIIESDEEVSQMDEAKVKKQKRKRREKRVLQISEDEEDSSDNNSEIDADSELDEKGENIIEYDSEENEVEVVPQKLKRKAKGFLEQEAELTSEDEWAGSEDEDEAGLDRMEREEGDDDTFHQGQLRKELGQIHMREVLDQDKREVRILQELLLEDGDLGEGHRQRKFRWKNADGEEMTGTVPNDLTDTQEEEFESEELWRKERHERNTFLRQMNEQETELFNSSITRNTIIKANLTSKSMSALLMEVNPSKTTESKEAPNESKDKDPVPSPMEDSFPLFKQEGRSSFLSRGKGALQRLAALAGPLAADADGEPTNTSALAPNAKRSFVFSILTPPPKQENKVAKRKAVSNEGTSSLVKKLKVEEESQKTTKRSLFEHINL